MNNKKLLASLFVGLFCLCICFIYMKNSNIKQKIDTEISLIKDKKSEHPNKFPIRLSDEERELLISNMKTSKNYLEFGSGGSTFLGLLNSDANIVSVENDKNWIKYLNEWDIIRTNNGHRVHLYYINNGPVGDWGYPVDFNKYRDLFPQYSSQVFEVYKKDYDLVFIDGRFRVACALQTILNTDNNVKILIHDFTLRPYYHAVLDFLTIEKTADTMVLLKKKQNIDKNKVIAMYEKYKDDSR